MAPRQQTGIFGVLLLPFSLALKCVFYPAHWIMWFLIDFLGAEVIIRQKTMHPEVKELEISEHREYWLPFLMGRDRKDKEGGSRIFKAVVSYLKEFRFVLYDWDWPRVSSPAWRCKSCPAKSEWYCVDCSKKFCSQCCYNLHASGSFSAGHSVEKLKPPRKCCHFITPLVPEFMSLAFALKLGYFTQMFGRDYLDSQMICPIVTQGRRIVGYLDTTLLYHYKDSFFSWCDTEDSGMRFIMDTWVRTIVTETDNVLLIFQTFPKALLFSLVVMYIVVPVVSVGYALISNFTYCIECYLTVGPTLLKLEKIAQWLSISDRIIAQTTPVETERRRRKEQDFADWFFYEYNRKLRAFRFYYYTCREGLQSFTTTLLQVTLVFRLGCFYAGLARPVRGICRLIPGLGSTINTHQVWYGHAQDMIVNEERMYFIIQKVWRFAPQPLKSYTVFLWWVALVVVVGCIYLIHRTVMERRNYFKNVWPSAGEYGEASVLNFGQPKQLVERCSSF